MNISLHPLVIINISDHATRARMGAGGKTQPRVIGALFGVQSGRSVEIFNSFEIVYTEVEGSVIIDTEYVKAKQEQCWYPPGVFFLPNSLVQSAKFLRTTICLDGIQLVVSVNPKTLKFTIR